MAVYKFISWNINGIRAQLKKGFDDYISKTDADFFLFQETKASIEIVKDIGSQFSDYHIYANEAVKKGYSGTAIFSKQKALREIYLMDIEDHDMEGRITALEFNDFYLVNVYVPNSGSGMKRLDYRKIWDADFLKFNQNLNKDKAVIIGGDLNVAREAIDLARPKANYNKTSGYTQTEIDGLDAFINAGFSDSFRLKNPDKVAYSFWSQRFKARDRNVGWRIDYFLMSPDCKEKLVNADIHTDVMGSDHCPIALELDFS